MPLKPGCSSETGAKKQTSTSAPLVLNKDIEDQIVAIKQRFDAIANVDVHDRKTWAADTHVKLYDEDPEFRKLVDKAQQEQKRRDRFRKEADLLGKEYGESDPDIEDPAHPPSSDSDDELFDPEQLDPQSGHYFVRFTRRMYHNARYCPEHPLNDTLQSAQHPSAGKVSSALVACPTLAKFMNEPTEEGNTVIRNYEKRIARIENERKKGFFGAAAGGGDGADQVLADLEFADKLRARSTRSRKRVAGGGAGVAINEQNRRFNERLDRALAKWSS